jgi:hypothetical protein
VPFVPVSKLVGSDVRRVVNVPPYWGFSSAGTVTTCEGSEVGGEVGGDVDGGVLVTGVEVGVVVDVVGVVAGELQAAIISVKAIRQLTTNHMVFLI